MKSFFNDERRMLLYTYLLLIAMFGNLSLLQQPFDTKAVILGVVMALLLGYAHFVIGRFFSDGDKYLMLFAFILSMIGIVTMYRIDPSVAIKQLIWFTLGVVAYVLVVVVLPDLKSFSKYKYVYLAGVIVFMAMATLIGCLLYTSDAADE